MVVLDNSKYYGALDMDELNHAIQCDDKRCSVAEDAISVEKAAAVFKRCDTKLKVKGRNMHVRLQQLDKAVVNKSTRMEGQTPTRAAGVGIIGAAPVMPTDITQHAAWYAKHEHWIKLRATKIRGWCNEVYEKYFAGIAPLVKTPGDRILMKVEHHQIKTGGGCDNCTPEKYVSTMKNFIYKGYESGLADLEAVHGTSSVWYQFAEALKDLRNDLESEGIAYGTLKPVIYSKVRLDQDNLSNDGTLGFPLFKKGMDAAGPDDVEILKLAYGVDLSDLLQGTVDDGLEGEDHYVGPCQIRHLVQELMKRTTFRISDSNMLFTIFERIQNHGWKFMPFSPDDDSAVKAGKQRTIWVPDCLWGGLHACILDAVMKEFKRVKPMEYPSLMNPAEQTDACVALMKRGCEIGSVVLSIDESQWDATLRADVMAFVHYNLIVPLFQPEYQDMAKMAVVPYCYKILQTADAIWRAGQADDEFRSHDEYVKSCTLEQGHRVFVKIINGLASGLKGTMHMGSSLNLVIQYSLAIRYEFERTPHRGQAAGDDAGTLFPKTLISPTFDQDTHPSEWEEGVMDPGPDMETAYRLVDEHYSSFGVMVNPAKQIWETENTVEYGAQPAYQFLQKVYWPDLPVQRAGSPARNVEKAIFCESTPYHLNQPQQCMAVMSTLQEGANSPFWEVACRIYLEYDTKLLNFYQTFGPESWNQLVQQANQGPHGLDQDRRTLREALKLEDKGTGSDTESAIDVANAISHGVSDIFVRIAQELPPTDDRWTGVDYEQSMQDLINNEEGLASGDMGSDDE